jgi:hypothetical protein
MIFLNLLSEYGLQINDSQLTSFCYEQDSLNNFFDHNEILSTKLILDI